MKKLLLIILLFCTSYTFSAVHSVTSLGDSGAGSLRDLIGSAASGDTIEFSVAGAITLSGGEITLSQDIYILSSGAANLTLSGNSTNRIFNIIDANIFIQSISFENGVVTGSGGAITNASTGTVTLDKCIFNSCSATDNGGALASEGDNLILRECTFTNNQAGFYGGALRINDGQVLINSCTFNGNTCNFSGAGIHHVSGYCALVNSTLSGNTATLNGGGFEGTLNVMNCTITGNSAAQGGGVSPGTSTFQNCIIYNNSAGTSGPDVQGNFHSNGNNLIGDTSSGSGFIASDIIAQDPQLDVLNLNGGYTATHALMSSSPCVDAGSCMNAPRVDQRDNPRIGYPDIGAYEFGGNPFALNHDAQSLCSGSTLSFGTLTIDTTGVYTQVFLSSEGCDSTVELTVTLLPVYFYTDQESICQGDSLIFGTQTLKTSGTFTEVFTSSLNCDSTVELTLTVNAPDLNVLHSGETLTASGTASSYQWLDCGNGQIIPGDTNQVFTATVNGQYAVIVTENGCTDTSACITVNTVGIGKTENSDLFKIHPNPSKGILSIDFKDTQTELMIKIFSSSAQLLQQYNFVNEKNIKLALEDYSPGIYFVSIISTDKSIMQKIIRTE